MCGQLLRSNMGRSQMYAACKHPLLIRLEGSNPIQVDEEALLAGKLPYLYRNPQIEAELLPYREFWKVVKAYAKEHTVTQSRALMDLLWVQVDYQANPPHPLVQYVLPSP